MPIVQRYSSFPRLIRVLTFVKRFIYNARIPKRKRRKIIRGPVSALEFSRAEQYCIRLVQLQCYPKVFKRDSDNLPSDLKMLSGYCCSPLPPTPLLHSSVTGFQSLVSAVNQGARISLCLPMSGSKKIDEFFTPKTHKTGLERGNSSPELITRSVKKQAGEMATLSQESIELLMEKFTGIMNGALDQKLRDITKDLATKDDVKELTQQVVNLQLENNTLREKVGALRSELFAREKRIDFLDNAIRRDNPIFSGLTHDGRNDLTNVIRSFIAQVLGISKQILTRDVINLGGFQPNSYLLVKFVESSDVAGILKATGRLRGKNFGINRDYLDAIRAVRKNSFAIRKELYRLKSTLKISIRAQYLIVEDVKFTWFDKGGILHKDAEGLPIINTLVSSDLGKFIRDRLKKCDTSAANMPTSA